MTDSKLDVQLYSFSYKHPIPGTESGHGGGFYFDCRCLPNPGREEEYKVLTGLDEPVQKYLESLTVVEDFWQSTSALANQAVVAYLDRGFDSLVIGYGCTGGQHRSVYFSERLQKQLQETPEVSVSLQHTRCEHWPDQKE